MSTMNMIYSLLQIILRYHKKDISKTFTYKIINKIRNNFAYNWDLINFQRQLNAVKGHKILRKIIKAYKNNNFSLFQESVQ